MTLEDRSSKASAISSFKDTHPYKTPWLPGLDPISLALESLRLDELQEAIQSEWQCTDQKYVDAIITTAMLGLNSSPDQPVSLKNEIPLLLKYVDDPVAAILEVLGQCPHTLAKTTLERFVADRPDTYLGQIAKLSLKRMEDRTC